MAMGLREKENDQFKLGEKNPRNYVLSFYFLKTLLCTVNYTLMTLQLKRVTKKVCVCV